MRRPAPSNAAQAQAGAFKGWGGRLLASPVFHLILIVYLGAAAYSNTFRSPFLWDESLYLVENPVVKDLSYFLEPSRARGLEQYDIFVNRYVGFLTFALNYRVHGLAVEGYHFVNLAIHLANAMMVYLLVVLTFRTPRMETSTLSDVSGFVALFSALLFVAHPVQTEAVTYVFQRLASLCTFFYLASLLLYVKHRLSRGGGAASWAPYALSVVSALLAMKTKEIAFTLPPAVALYEFLFLSGPPRSRSLRLLPLALTMTAIPLTMIGKSSDRFLPAAAEAVGGVMDLSALDYMLTEFRVVVTYLRLLLLPINQNFDYDYPSYNSFLAPPVFLSFISLALLFSAGVWALRRSRRGEPALRLVAFGVFWFFLTLSVESTLIRIPMLINEYRIYLPSAAALPAFVAAMFIAGKAAGAKNAVLAAFMALSVLLAAATFSRNSLWRTESGLWQDAAAKSPRKVRAHNNLCNSLILDGRLEEAIGRCNHALTLDPYNPMSNFNLGIAYSKKEDWGRAIEHLDVTVLLEPDNAWARLYAGLAYGSSGRPEKAIEHLEAALRLRRHIFDAKAFTALGDYYNAAGRHKDALGAFKKALEIEPGRAEAMNGMGNALFFMGDLEGALASYREAIRANPALPEPRRNAVKVLLSLGEKAEAREELEALRKINPEYAEKIRGE